MSDIKVKIELELDPGVAMMVSSLLLTYPQGNLARLIPLTEKGKEEIIDVGKSIAKQVRSQVSFKDIYEANCVKHEENMKSSKAYRLGFDCGMNGANDTNSHFSIFNTPEKTEMWEKGKGYSNYERSTR